MVSPKHRLVSVDRLTRLRWAQSLEGIEEVANVPQDADAPIVDPGTIDEPKPEVDADRLTSACCEHKEVEVAMGTHGT